MTESFTGRPACRPLPFEVPSAGSDDPLLAIGEGLVRVPRSGPIQRFDGRRWRDYPALDGRVRAVGGASLDALVVLTSDAVLRLEGDAWRAETLPEHALATHLVVRHP
ncbi:MAG: hypothetical protein KC619_18975 [Myxococcales bacterium]|nr:hypothetical protein [Myxococcales bacterium]